jgi:hypothetical protein
MRLGLDTPKGAPAYVLYKYKRVISRLARALRLNPNAKFHKALLGKGFCIAAFDRYWRGVRGLC